MASLARTATLRDYQAFISDVYSLPDDRLYSIWDLLTQQQRFTMRTLKGIRKNDLKKIRLNLLISFSWLMSIANRLHIDIEDEVWKRFPYLCSYCGKKPCICKEIKSTKRVSVKSNDRLRPKNLSMMQKMFDEIYPRSKRSLVDAGIHLAEEMGEVSEGIHNYIGLHESKQFDEIKLEIADFMSCAFGVANSAKIDCAKELADMFKNNCHVCHKAPCICSFSTVVNTKS